MSPKEFNVYLFFREHSMLALLRFFHLLLFSLFLSLSSSLLYFVRYVILFIRVYVVPLFYPTTTPLSLPPLLCRACWNPGEWVTLSEKRADRKRQHIVVR